MVETVLRTFGCDACADLTDGGPAIVRLNDGPITQSGIQYTILASKYDELVTPAPEASFVNEPGVRNLLIQDFCPNGECSSGEGGRASCALTSPPQTPWATLERRTT